MSPLWCQAVPVSHTQTLGGSCSGARRRVPGFLPSPGKTGLGFPAPDPWPGPDPEGTSRWELSVSFAFKGATSQSPLPWPGQPERTVLGRGRGLSSPGNAKPTCQPEQLTALCCDGCFNVERTPEQCRCNLSAHPEISWKGS